MYDDPRVAIARLAAAVMAADERITSAELGAVAGLERLGLGSLEAATREALIEAARAPVDVPAVCAALADVGPDAAGLVLAVLADIVTSDGGIDPREGEVLAEIAAHLRLPVEVSAEIIHAAAARNVEAREHSRPIPIRSAEPAAVGRPRAESAGALPAAAAPGRAPDRAPPALAGAYAALRLPAGASTAAVDEAYRAVVERYQPAKVIDLGPEFAVLAVRRLAAATAAYTALVEARDAR